MRKVGCTPHEIMSIVIQNKVHTTEQTKEDQPHVPQNTTVLQSEKDLICSFTYSMQCTMIYQNIVRG